MPLYNTSNSAYSCKLWFLINDLLLLYDLPNTASLTGTSFIDTGYSERYIIIIIIIIVIIIRKIEQ